MRKPLLRFFAMLFAVALFATACGADDIVDDVTDAAGDVADAATDAASDAADAASDVAEEAVDAVTGDDEEEAMAEEEAMEEEEEEAMAEEEAMEEEEPAAAATEVFYGNAQEFSNYNNGLASSNSVKNTIVMNEVLSGVWNFEGPGGGVVFDDDFVDSVTVLSEDPLSIEYVVNQDAVWSDGDPIDCDEFYMVWQIYGGTHVQLDENGDPVIDEESELELQLFDITGTTGIDVIDTMECSDDGKTITTTYTELFADWPATFGGLLPAHVVAREAGVDDLKAAFDSNDRPAIEAMAEVFNNLWAMNPGELLDESLIPSSGPYKLGSWDAGASLTLVPNENYWGTPANAPLTIRYIAEEAQAQALANGEINAMDPQPTPDLIAQLEGTDGIVIEGGSQFVWEHFDFNFNTVFANRDVREAFALCAPRQQIVSNLILPLDPSATILNNRYNQQFEPAYVDASAGAYDAVDLERAAELLANSGESLPIDVRIGWFDNGGNARRTDQVALTQASCNQVEGFNIIDNGSDTFFDVELAAGDWDIAMFAWAGSPLKTGSSEIYRTGGGINFGGYGNDAVDALLDQINATPDADEQAKIANDVDAILWEDLVTIPIFSFPGVLAYSDNIDGVVYNPSQNGLTWNGSTWAIS